MSLKIEDVAAQRSFVFLWCGSCEGLDLGRQVHLCVLCCMFVSIQVYVHVRMCMCFCIFACIHTVYVQHT